MLFRNYLLCDLVYNIIGDWKHFKQQANRQIYSNRIFTLCDSAHGLATYPSAIMQCGCSTFK